MSEETPKQEAARAQLDRAVSEFINAAAGNPVLVTGWVLMASSTDPEEGITAYRYCDNEIPYHHAWGLVRWGKKHLDDTFDMSLDDDD